MKSVLHIPSYFPPSVGGLEQTAFDVVEALRGNCSQAVLCFNHVKGESDKEENGVRVIRLKPNIKLSSQTIAVSFKKRLKQILNEFKPDIIHFHFPNPYASHYLLKSKFKGKLIVHWHSDIIKQRLLKKLFTGQTEKLLARADKIIATSPNYIEHSEFLPRFKDKCVMIQSAINLEKLTVDEQNLQEAKQIKEKHKDKILCFFVGRHVPYKGLKYLLQSARYADDNIEFIIGGSGELTDELEKQAKPCKNIQFVGRLSDKELISYLIACDIFTFPSITKNEAFGLALAEAMYFSKPAITFKIEGSGVNYVSLDKITGIECPNGDAESFASAINLLAKNTSLREEYGKNAKARAEELFLFDAFKKNLLELYQQ